MNFFQRVKRKIRREIQNIKNPRLTLADICSIGGVELPDDLKSKGSTKISKIIFCAPATKKFPKNCAVFYPSTAYFKKNLTIEDKNSTFLFAIKPANGYNCIVCDNPWEVGAQVGRYLRNRSKATFVGVTGSVGKTSTKEMIESVLKEGFGDKLHASKGNSNSLYRVMQNILSLPSDSKVYLQELCAGGFSTPETDERCEHLIGKSAKVFNADVAVFTNVRDNHIEHFGSREAIAEHKLKLAGYGNPNGLAIYNYDDPLLRNAGYKQKSVSFSLSDEHADYYAKDIKYVEGGTSFTIVDKVRNSTLKAKVGAIGDQFVINALTAYAVGKYFNLDDKTIVKGIKKYKTSGERCNLFKAGHNWVYADCYNSSYDALAMMLKSFCLTEMKNGGRKIAVIGDIFELGELSDEIHTKCGELAAQHDIDMVLFCGENAKLMYAKYTELKDNCIYCRTQDELVEELEKIMLPNDMILFKASHGMGFSDVIDTVFGEYIGEKDAISHNSYYEKQDEAYTYQVFSKHITVKSLNTQPQEICTLPDAFMDMPVRKLASNLFKNVKGVKKVVLPAQTSLIRPNCFENSSVEEIEFNPRLRRIASRAFQGCSQLEKLELPQGLMSVGVKAFCNCKKLTEVYIPESVGEISSTAFDGCPNVQLICKAGSYAEGYAKKHNIKYKTL